jgi:prepilin-type N-terminal cleavage/methylation domain-containing protein
VFDRRSKSDVRLAGHASTELVEVSRGRLCHKSGFTLIEVMISIAIALVLILGIAQIFSMAQRTTGAGTQVLADTETNRGIQQMLLNDARGITNGIGDSPGLVILSYPAAAFRNRPDQQQDNDADVTTLNDPANAGKSLPPEAISAIDDRIHRTDVLGFFSRGKFTRQTGDSGNPPDPKFPPSLTSPTTSEEAFIWYGHLALPDNNLLNKWNYKNPGALIAAGTAQFWSPGAGTAATNPNNFFASDWILGRQVILLSPRATSNEPHIMGTSSGAKPLWLPIAQPSVANDSGIPLYASRYDLADATIASYRQSFTAPTSSPPPPQWWLGWQGLSGWDISSSGRSMKNPVQTRFLGNPFLRKPTTTGTGTETQQLSAAIAQMSPVFVRGCTQFIVEFAGDFLTQNASANGAITAGRPDGQIDYVDVVDPSNPSKHLHQTRWYGFPRNAGATTGGMNLADPGWVLPVSTVLSLANIPTVGHYLDFERSPALPASGSVPPPPPWTGAWTQNSGNAAGGLPSAYPGAPTYSGALVPYGCAWGPDTDGFSVPRPKMIRVTIGIDDPTGHLNTQQLYEYVFNLP